MKYYSLKDIERSHYISEYMLKKKIAAGEVQAGEQGISESELSKLAYCRKCKPKQQKGETV